MRQTARREEKDRTFCNCFSRLIQESSHTLVPFNFLPLFCYYVRRAAKNGKKKKKCGQIATFGGKFEVKIWSRGEEISKKSISLARAELGYQITLIR